jgi:flagellar motor switch protein FliG
MSTGEANLRKAAVLVRTLDADSAAALLAQLSPAEAARIRAAIRALGPVDPNEQTSVLAEFRRARPVGTNPVGRGVELALSNKGGDLAAATTPPAAGGKQKRFEFLENAPTSVLVSHLAREHAQTIAVVLAHLAPGHAAEVLAALPENCQIETIERLSTLGDTDSESVAVLESELAAWVEKRMRGRARRGGRQGVLADILAAADAKTRAALGRKIAPPSVAKPAPATSPRDNNVIEKQKPILESSGIVPRPIDRPDARRQPVVDRVSVPGIEFEHLVYLDDASLTAVLQSVDANVLALALAGSSDRLIDRICARMPKAVARAFQREVRRLGPTRLSDVEAAQRLVADFAAQRLAQRRASANWA